jgi:hypothetical protein
MGPREIDGKDALVITLPDTGEEFIRFRNGERGPDSAYVFRSREGGVITIFGDECHVERGNQ